MNTPMNTPNVTHLPITPPHSSTKLSGEPNPAVSVGVEDPKPETRLKNEIEGVKERADRPSRAGVFATVAAADRVVQRLFEAGYSSEEVSVVCSEETHRKHFGALVHDKPAGTYTPAAAVAGSVIGATFGGLAAIAGVVTTGVVVGGLIGAMMTRGFERELANFYDQAVTKGQNRRRRGSERNRRARATLGRGGPNLPRGRSRVAGFAGRVDGRLDTS